MNPNGLITNLAIVAHQIGITPLLKAQKSCLLKGKSGKGSLTVPIYWELLDNNSGNSNSEERIAILKKCVQLIGVKNISYIAGDREFIGHKWLKWLKDKQIAFCVRVPKSHLIEKVDGTILHAQQVFKPQKPPTTFQKCLVDGVWVSATIDTDAKGELLFLIGTVKAEYLTQFYKKRWTIETVFQAFKERGFNLENTHFKKK